MVTPKIFHMFIPAALPPRKDFEILRDHSKLPNWFHTKYLMSWKAVFLKAWLVKAAFNKNRKHIHVE